MSRTVFTRKTKDVDDYGRTTLSPFALLEGPPPLRNDGQHLPNRDCGCGTTSVHDRSQQSSGGDSRVLTQVSSTGGSSLFGAALGYSSRSRRIYEDNVTTVEHRGGFRGRFATARGVRQGCPASGFLFTVAFGRICACADDFAVAAHSFRLIMPILAGAFQIIDAVIGIFLHHRKCYCVQCGLQTCDDLSRWVGHARPDVRAMRISSFTKKLSAVIGPVVPDHLWNEALSQIMECVCAGISASPQSLVQKLVAFKVYALSVLCYVGSIHAPDHENLRADTSAFQKLTAGLLNTSTVCPGQSLDQDWTLLEFVSPALQPVSLLPYHLPRSECHRLANFSATTPQWEAWWLNPTVAHATISAFQQVRHPHGAHRSALTPGHWL